jgi:hypothetical protein
MLIQAKWLFAKGQKNKKSKNKNESWDMPAMADADLLLETFGLGLYRQKWLFAKSHTKK